MKNILFVVDDKKMGGVSILLEDILNRLNLNKFNIDLLILKNEGELLSKIPSKINILYGDEFFYPINYSLSSAIKEKKLKKIIDKALLVLYMKTPIIKYIIKSKRKKILKKQYDTELAFKDGFCGLFVGYGDSKRKVQWLHADYSSQDDIQNYKTKFKKLYKNFDRIVGISKPVAKYFNDKYGCEDKTICIYNFVNTQKVIEKSNEYEIKKDSKKINFVSVGRFHKMKGYLRLIRVINKLNQNNEFNNCHLTIVGDGPEYNEAINLIKDYDIGDKITLIGSKQNPFPYVKNSDCFIMGSVYEPFGLTVIEALTLKVPVLSTEVATIREMLSKEYGLIVENSEKGLYNGFKKIINNKNLLKNYKKNVKNYQYDTKKIIKQIENLLEGKLQNE
ncbi:MAG: glycosyltransferase [Bacilli bacterium]|nr:glycosyltransferase [Bacilli bacterium]